MDSRERVARVLNHEEADRVPFVEFFWNDTIERWHAEGLPRDVMLEDYFGFDMCLLAPNLSPKYDQIVLDEDSKFRTYVDEWGVRLRTYKGKNVVSTPVGPPLVSTIEDFKERLEPLLDPTLPSRVSSSSYPLKGDLEKAIKKLQQRFSVYCSVAGPWGLTRHIFGDTVDKILIMVHRDPQLVEYIITHLSKYISEIAKVYAELGVDGLWLWSDIAHKGGPFISPQMYDRLLSSAHQHITSPYRHRNLPVVYHTDGDIHLLIPNLIRDGITAINPLEVNAGMDVIDLKKEYRNELSFIGNLNASKIHIPEEIEKEIASKIPIAAEGGGYVASSDNSIPPDVSLSSFIKYTELIRKYGKYAKS